MGPRPGRQRKRGGGSLAVLVQALEGSRVVVELRQDTVVRGTLAAADDHMNLHLSDVTYQPLQGPRRQMGALFLRARHVRFIHLPGNLAPAAAVEAHRRRTLAAMREHAQQQAAAATRLQKGVQLELGAGGGGSGGGGAAEG